MSERLQGLMTQFLRDTTAAPERKREVIKAT
jgi:hypothetical protein